MAFPIIVPVNCSFSCREDNDDNHGMLPRRQLMHYHVDQIEDVLLGESLAATGGDIAQSDSQDELGNV